MADKQISELPATGALLDAGVFPVQQGGVTVKVTGAQVIARAPVQSVNGRTGAIELNDADVPAAVETITGTTRNLGDNDAGKYQRWTATGAKTLTVRPNSEHPLQDREEFHIRNAAASGDLTISPGAGVTINPPKGGSLVLEPGDTCTLKRISADLFDLFGSTALA